MPAKLQPRAFIMRFRIVLGGLIFGMMTFAAVSLYLNLGDNSFESYPEQTRIYGWILIALGVGVTIASRLVGLIRPNPAMISGIDAPEPVATRVAAYGVQTLIRGALTVGFGLFGTTLYLLTAQWYFFAAPAISLVIILRLMPTETRIRELLRGPGGTGGYAPAIKP